jgi:hypothetical protein
MGILELKLAIEKSDDLHSYNTAFTKGNQAEDRTFQPHILKIKIIDALSVKVSQGDGS